MPTLLQTGLLLLLLGVLSPAWGEEQVLRLYGPGGPLAPMQECAELFARRHKVQVIVVAGPESRWLDQARKDADLIFGGAEYMLTQWAQKYPGLIDEGNRTSLYVRPAAILVRPGKSQGHPLPGGSGPPGPCPSGCQRCRAGGPVGGPGRRPGPHPRPAEEHPGVRGHHRRSHRAVAIPAGAGCLDHL
ncbi:MAG: substrate-binding domain-containing protein [Syntrophobacterales bacterium]|nr:substrate-binding domain-containing protein [Syntrophobacterales bacterium]